MVQEKIKPGPRDTDSGLVAQLEEQGAFTPEVEGSTPSELTIRVVGHGDHSGSNPEGERSIRSRPAERDLTRLPRW